MIVRRLRLAGISATLVGAGMLLAGVAHAADEATVTDSQDSSVVTSQTSQSDTMTVTVINDSTTPTPPSADTGGDVMPPPTATTDEAPAANSNALATPGNVENDSPSVTAPAVSNVVEANVIIQSTSKSSVRLSLPGIPVVFAPAAIRQAVQAADEDMTGVPAASNNPPIQPKPALPPAGSLQLAAIWSNVTLPFSNWLSQPILGSRADSWPLALVILIGLAMAVCATFVSILKRTGYSRAARSDAAPIIFTTPSFNVSLIRYACW